MRLFFVLKCTSVSRISALSGLVALCLACCASAWAQSRWDAVPAGSDGTPRGHWVFQPSGYAADPERDFAVVIWLHGLGRGGDGSIAELQRLLGAGPPSIIDNSEHPLNGLFEQRQVVVLAPQLTDGVWWKDHHIRPFLEWAKANYRLDERRLWLTGQSAGASGIHHFMNNDPGARDIAAFLPVAVRGRVLPGEGDYLGEFVPYWAVTARGDASNTATRSVDQLAGFRNGVGSTDVMSSYPNPDFSHTAVFDGNQWNWREQQVSAETGVSPKLTLYPGSDHNSWDETYNNPEVWDWVFDQVKPGLEVTSPNDGATVLSDAVISAQAMLATWEGRSLEYVRWYSSIDGFLGNGESIAVTLDTPGTHELSVEVRDDGFGTARSSITVEVVDSGMVFGDQFQAAGSRNLPGSRGKR